MTPSHFCVLQIVTHIMFKQIFIALLLSIVEGGGVCC